ncbi:MAG: beta-ketoacyl-ACP synthase II [Rhodobacteraceae bacterium]|nr:beta-ketoacyl-ACP synthase II [Paracoccaceae bacterium]
MVRRVVVTGLGVVTPLGCGVETTWKNLLDGQGACKTIAKFDASHLITNYACEIPSGPNESFNPDDWMPARDRRKIDDFILYSMVATDQAIEDAGWKPSSEKEQFRAGVLIGSGIGGLSTIADTTLQLKEKGPRRISPFFIPGSLINLASGQVSIRYDFKGPNQSTVTACATGAHALGDAAKIIMADEADVMIAGGSESPICEIGIAGFNACKALSTQWREQPEKASRPFDTDRDGFVMGEGAGIVVLEELEHANKRGARIYAEITGYGLSGDAYHITAPSEDGSGGLRSMEMAMTKAKINNTDLDYINAHGTSTMADTIELGAVRKLLGSKLDNVSISSTKSSIGHLLGAAGAVEAIFSIMAIRDQVVPPTINLENPVVSDEFDLVPNIAKQRNVNHAMSNSFGFGGSNATLIFSKL